MTRKNAPFASPLTLALPLAHGARFGVTLAADAGGQPGLVLPVATIAPVLMGEMGTGAMNRPAGRRPRLTARGAAPGAPIAAWPARWSSPARCVDAAAGRRLMAVPVDGGIGPPEQTGLRLACPGAALRSAWPQIWMRNLADYFK